MGCGELCCIFSQDTKAAFKTSKWFYFGILIWASILTWVLRDYSDDLLEKFKEIDACEKYQDNNTSACYGKGAVLRVSFATAVFYGVLFLVLINCKKESDERCIVHTACPALKVVIWLILVIISFTLPHGFYEVYWEIARVFSGLFLVFQAMLLIELAYSVNEKLLAREECQWALIALTSIAYVLSFIIIGFAYHYYAPRGTCSTNIGWITWTLICGILITIASLSNLSEQAGLLSSGVVFLYCCFLLATALSNMPANSECSRSGGMSSGWMKVAAFLVALVAVVISAMTTGIAKFFDSGESDSNVPYRPDFFHFVFFLASMYMAMLFTNWTLSGTASDLTLDNSEHSGWVKIASQWFVFLLFFWTMIAPKVLKNRVFS